MNRNGLLGKTVISKPYTKISCPNFPNIARPLKECMVYTYSYILSSQTCTPKIFRSVKLQLIYNTTLYCHLFI